jgi:hypothetical protein
MEFGIAAFVASVDAVVMGRATYDVEHRMDDWPHPGKPTFVVTSRPLADPPPLVEARSGWRWPSFHWCWARAFRFSRRARRR